MPDGVLVTYGSWTGTTAEVARKIAERLRDAGLEVRCSPAREVRDLSGYRAAVIGTPVRAGRLHAHVVRLVKQQCSRLSGMPRAYFVVCLTMKEDTAENRVKAEAFLRPLNDACQGAALVEPGLFAGAVLGKGEALSALPLAQRIALGVVRSQAGDYRDWNAIVRWADELASRLRAAGRQAGA